MARNCLRDGAGLKKVSYSYITTVTIVLEYDIYECPICGELTFWRRSETAKGQRKLEEAAVA